MSYLNKKPKWCPTAIATEQGWVNSLNGELLVSLRGLKSKIDAEIAAELATQSKKEVIMQVQEEKAEDKQTKSEVIKEETVKKPKKKQKLLGEVVEFKINDTSEIIGE